jgi:hypothetical protein
VKVVEDLIHRYISFTKIDKQTKESKPKTKRNQGFNPKALREQNQGKQCQGVTKSPANMTHFLSAVLDTQGLYFQPSYY